MKLIKARVQNYRSIIDSGWFDVESEKTIMVGPNEAGKTILLQALQQINPPEGVTKFNALRDYPREKLNEITEGRVNPENVTVVEAHFRLDENDISEIPEEYRKCIYVFGRKLDNSCWHRLIDGPQIPTFAMIKKDLLRFCANIDAKAPHLEGDNALTKKPSMQLTEITQDWSDESRIEGEKAVKLCSWLENVYHYIDENNDIEENRYEKLHNATKIADTNNSTLQIFAGKLPLIVLFNNYFRVKPLIHLEHLANRVEQNSYDDKQYDYGNLCLLKLLGFNARELSNLGKAPEPKQGQPQELQVYRDTLDKRWYQLNSASVHLTNEINNVWNPDPNRSEASRLRVQADGQYLKVVVEDDLGVEIELDQRSEGFQWLVSFFVVFFAEAAGKHKNAILLLDEPGLSLHGLKQRDFRKTISRLALHNQTIYTTHSPFLVGPDELNLVRVVEMKDRKIGTKVHTTITADDPAAMLPLQEALGYDLAQSLFSNQRNLILEGLTDFWYIEAISELLLGTNTINLNNKISLIPAGSAGKVVYYATILYAQGLKVAALLDSDAAGDQAAQQDVLVHTLGNKNILRTKDVYIGEIVKPEIEDLLRHTLVDIAKKDLNWDIEKKANLQSKRPIVDIFSSEITDFSKYKLSKAFLRWARNHEYSDLTSEEQTQWKGLIENINRALK
jgi:hypothetical protein